LTNFKEIIIDFNDKIAKDFEVRYKGKKILARRVCVLVDLDKIEFVKDEDRDLQEA